MKDTSKWMIALMCAVFIASPALGTVVYYGGTGANSQGAPGTVTGGAYYDTTAGANNYNTEYGVEAHVYTDGQGVSTSSWTNSATITQTPTVGGNPYKIILSYGGPSGSASVLATATQTDDNGYTHADAGVYAHAYIADDGAGDTDLQGWADIYSGAGVDTRGSALGTASGVAAYDVSKTGVADEIWGTASGISTAYANQNGVFDTQSHDANSWSDVEANNGDISAYSESQNSIGAAPSGGDCYYSEAYTEQNAWSPYVNQYGHDTTNGHAYLSESGFIPGQPATAYAGAWDRETPSNLIKQQGVNENAYSTAQGTLTSEAMTNLYSDNAKADGYNGVGAANYYDSNTGTYDQTAYDSVSTFGAVYRDQFPSDNQRATADTFLTDGNDKAVAQTTGLPLPFVASISASNMLLGSGAHALNPTGGEYWYSEIRTNGVFASDDLQTRSAETYFDAVFNTKGPQVIVSGTMMDDAGSIISMQNINLQAASISQSTNNINFINWIEGSDLNTDMFPLVQNWVNTNTGPSHDEDYTRVIDNSNTVYRYNDADIYAATYN